MTLYLAVAAFCFGVLVGLGIAQLIVLVALTKKIKETP